MGHHGLQDGSHVDARKNQGTVKYESGEESELKFAEIIHNGLYECLVITLNPPEYA